MNKYNQQKNNKNRVKKLQKTINKYNDIIVLI